MSDNGSTFLDVLAAGSLRTAFFSIVAEFERLSGVSVRLEHGPAGLLREKIEQGAPFDVFTSANMAHPQRLQELGLSGPVECFTRNSLCVISRRELGMNDANMLEVLLDPMVKLGTSTPVADPSGDYALEFFDKVEGQYSGKGRRLSEKAQPLVGGRVPVEIPTGYSAAGWLIENGLADAFISYASNGLLSQHDERLKVIAIPETLGPMAYYGVTLSPKAGENGMLFRDHLQSAWAQAEFQRHGFMGFR